MADFSFNQQLVLTLIDKAVIGGVLIFAVYRFNKFLETFKSDRAALLETFKSQLAKDHEADKTVRFAVADITKKIAAGSHIICWLCWYAKYSPSEVTVDSFCNYEKEMHSTQTELVGLRVVLAALDRELHTTLSPFINRLYQMDVEVGQAKVLYLTSNDKGLNALGNIHEKSLLFDKDLLSAVTNLERFR